MLNIARSLNTRWNALFTGGNVTHNMRSRNRFPKAIVDLLLAHYPLQPGQLGADLGAASGRLSALFLEHGFNVIAIEPDEAKRQACARLRDRWDHFEIGHGTPTATGLAAHSIDFAISQRAIYHPDQPALRRELQRILKPRAPIVLITDSRVYSGAAQSEQYEAFLRTHCPGFREKTTPFDIAATVKNLFANGHVIEDAFIGQQSLTIDALIDETRALPICPHPTAPTYQPMLRALRDYFNQYATEGILHVPTVCRVAIGHFE